MAFKIKHKVGIDEVGKDLKMTNRSLIVLFQNTASFHSDSIHYGILDIAKTNLTWFVIDWKVKVLKRPKYGDELTIKNWSRDSYKCFSYLDFEIYVNGKLYVQATSKWVLYNYKNKSYENISDDLLELYGSSKKKVFKEELDHMNPLDKYDHKKKIEIRKSDLDFNNHVNNVNYFNYLVDYSEASEYSCFRITYRKEIKEDEIVFLCHSKVNNIDFYAIIDQNDDVKTIIECE